MYSGIDPPVLFTHRVSGKAFDKFFEDNPDSMLRMVQVISHVKAMALLLLIYFFCLPLQIIMLRLQRVTFLALNQFLGLGRELLNQVQILVQYFCC